ncbi:MAG: hypothetical protein GF334_00385 [Candidatus Altiarchaeales archaeon]|nr:hypothetical protein [Candidatus Altiarchaeales archaeon]
MRYREPDYRLILIFCLALGVVASTVLTEYTQINQRIQEGLGFIRLGMDEFFLVESGLIGLLAFVFLYVFNKHMQVK